MKIEHIIIGLLVLGFVTGYISISGFQAAQIQPTIQPAQVITCDSTVTPDIDINAYDIDNPTTAITDDKNLYRKMPDGSWVSWTLGTAITGLEYGEKYEFFMPADTTTSNIPAKGFCKYITWTAPCRETTEMKIYCVNDETYDGLTAAWVNADDNPATAETFTAGQVQTVRLRWYSAKDEYYGHPYLTSYSMLTDNGNHRRQYPNILCLKLNSTAWEKPQDVYLLGGTKLNRISNPTIASADGATTHIMYCYEAPVITDIQTDIYVKLEADGTYAPAVDDKAYLYAGNLFINSDTGQVEWGVEDNNAAYTAGNSDADELTLDFT